MVRSGSLRKIDQFVFTPRSPDSDNPPTANDFTRYSPLSPTQRAPSDRTVVARESSHTLIRTVIAHTHVAVAVIHVFGRERQPGSQSPEGRSACTTIRSSHQRP